MIVSAVGLAQKRRLEQVGFVEQESYYIFNDKKFGKVYLMKKASEVID